MQDNYQKALILNSAIKKILGADSLTIEEKLAAAGTLLPEFDRLTGKSRKQKKEFSLDTAEAAIAMAYTSKKITHKISVLELSERYGITPSSAEKRLASIKERAKKSGDVLDELLSPAEVK